MPGPRMIILMRHAERLDRALEAKGEDWISSASRPQDPMISPEGQEQARRVGKELKRRGYPISKILCSPLIRCVQTAHIVASELDLEENTICVETGLIEEAKSMRGKAPPEPLPVWDPLYHSSSDLQWCSSLIDLSYVPMMQVYHERNDNYKNHVQEVLPESNEKDPDIVTGTRCQMLVQELLAAKALIDECVLCVGHGASVKYCAISLQEGLPSEDLLIKGERSVSCFAAFTPLTSEWDGSGPCPYVSREGVWDNGHADLESEKDNTNLPSDNADDRG